MVSLLWVGVAFVAGLALIDILRKRGRTALVRDDRAKPLSAMPGPGWRPGRNGNPPTWRPDRVLLRVLVGVVLDIVDDPLQSFERYLGAVCGPDRPAVFRYRFFGDQCVVVADADAAKHILSAASKRYAKEEDPIVKDVVGNGLLLSNGALWERQRRTMQPVFGHARVKPMVPAFNVAARELTDRWEALVAATNELDGLGGNVGALADIHSHMTQLTLDVIGRVAFACDFGAQAAGSRSDVAALHGDTSCARAELPQAVTVVLRETEARLFRLVPTWKLPFSKANAEYEAAKVVMLRAIRKAIAEKSAAGARESTKETGDLIDSLLSARDPETGDAISEEQLLDELSTFLIAGHETTAAMLSFLFYELAYHPELQNRLRLEVDALYAAASAANSVGDDERDLDFGSISAQDTSYMELCMRETLRLYPSVSMMTTRVAQEGDTIAGYHIPPGTCVEVWPWLLHRNPNTWERPSEFQPERHTEPATASRSTFAYLPFGAGPRNCIGKKLAWLEAKVVIARAVRRFVFEPQPGTKREDMRPKLTITLRPSAFKLLISRRIHARPSAAQPRSN